MSHSSSPTDQHSEWHVLLQGERLGPFSPDALRAVLETHPDGWQASVWQLGMLDWRAAESVAALLAAAPAPEPPGGQILLARGTARFDSAAPRASAGGLRDTAGELRVLSYAERTAPAREPPPAAPPAQPITPTPEATGEWSLVATSELRAFGTSELQALSAPEPSPAETGDWAAVGTSELRVLVTSTSSAQATLSELRAVTTRDVLPDAALPSVIISAETSTELPSFSSRAEREARPAAGGAPTPTPRALPVYQARPTGRPASFGARALALRPHAGLLIMGSLLLLSAGALGISLTLRWLRAAEAGVGHERAYARAPLPPLPTEQPGVAHARTRALRPHEALPAPTVPALPAADAPPASDLSPPAATHETTLAEPAEPHARRAAKHARPLAGGADSGAASRVDSVRVTAAWAKVRVGNDAEARVVCMLPRGTVRPVVTALPSAGSRWFALRCDARTVGWVHESDLALAP
jgi:GYF domain 2